MRNRKMGGFIGLIIMLVVALAFAKYFFEWNVIDFIKNPKVLEVFIYIKKFILLAWNLILVKPVTFIWNEVVVGIIWKTIVLAYDLLRGWVDSKP